MIAFYFQDRHTGYLESHLLDVVRVIQKNHVYPVWVEKSVCVYIKVGEFNKVKKIKHGCHAFFVPFRRRIKLIGFSLNCKFCNSDAGTPFISPFVFMVE